MPPDIKSHPLNNLSLKILAVVFGYTLWKSMSDIHKVQISMRAPISFYNEQGVTLDAPESVGVTLFAHRDTIYQLTREIAVHIDAQTLTTGTNKVALNEKILLLPDSVKLVDCEPDSVTISVEKV